MTADQRDAMRRQSPGRLKRRNVLFTLQNSSSSVCNE
jgi:hypothetical protein